MYEAASRTNRYNTHRQAAFTPPTLESWEHVSMDFMGPFSRSRSGHTILLVSQDRFTKWVELEPLRRATTAAVRRHLEHRIMYRHGYPRVVTTDNGRQFSSRSFQGFLRDAGITHRPSPVYKPQCNSVERANRTVKTMICQYVGKKHRAWEEHLPALQFAFNAAQQTSTGFSPAYLNFGRELNQTHTPRIPTDAAPLTPTVRAKHLADVYKLV